MTLISAKKDLRNELYDAFYDAYMTQYTKNTSDKVYTDDERDRENGFKKLAKDFSNELADGMSDAIYNFVKDMSINITIPPSVVSPSGPCSGTILNTYIKIT